MLRWLKYEQPAKFTTLNRITFSYLFCSNCTLCCESPRKIVNHCSKKRSIGKRYFSTLSSWSSSKGISTFFSYNISISSLLKYIFRALFCCLVDKKRWISGVRTTKYMCCLCECIYSIYEKCAVARYRCANQTQFIPSKKERKTQK